ncbi:MAG: hypothetical protein ACFCVD_01470 [Nodosilinea sp.]
MKSLDTTSQLNRPAADGWVIHVYDGNRRLLCSLEPLHGWIFAVGVGVGLVLALLMANLAAPGEPSQRLEVAPTMTAPLQVD